MYTQSYSIVLMCPHVCTSILNVKRRQIGRVDNFITCTVYGEKNTNEYVGKRTSNFSNERI